MTGTADRIRRFRALHDEGCFVLPNPWDVGSALLLERLGFPAVATTSSGFAWTLGRPDGGATLAETLAHCRALVAAARVPVSADFEDGFGADPGVVHDHVALAAATGLAGLSIEDRSGDPADPLLDAGLAVERVRAARQALDDGAPGAVLTARSEGFVVGRPDLSETIRRLVAFADAGADCLFAPGLRDLGDIRAVVTAVAPKPVNVLVGAGFASVAELAGIGVRRISVGSGLARAALGAFLDAAREIAEEGTFGRLGAALPFRDVNGAFGP